MDQDRHQQVLARVEHDLEQLLDDTAACIGTSTTTYRAFLWEAKDTVKRATSQLERVPNNEAK